MKLFIIANPDVRAHRRWLELKVKGSKLSEAEVLADLKERDARDAERKDAPMKRPKGAHLLDTSDLSIEAAFAAGPARSSTISWIEAQPEAEILGFAPFWFLRKPSLNAVEANVSADEVVLDVCIRRSRIGSCPVGREDDGDNLSAGNNSKELQDQ